MSLLDEVQAAVGNRLRNYDVSLYPDWVSFWAACPLSRRMFVYHDRNGNELTTPENDPDRYQNAFFGVDSVGVVLSQNGQPVMGSVYRRLEPDLLENTIRVGPLVRVGLRKVWWALGIRRIKYKIRENTTAADDVSSLETDHETTRRETLRKDGYTHYEITLKDLWSR
jgi:hypothetical protein